MNVIKQVVGIDASKDRLEVRFGTLTETQEQTFSGGRTFDNTLKGHRALLRWALDARVSQQAPLWFVMEATGVYHEHLAYFLAEQQCSVVIVLPNKAKHYAKTLEVKSKTDPIDATTLTRFGLEKQLKPWQLPSPLMRTLKLLTREYHAIRTMASQVKNQRHAKAYTHQVPKELLKRQRQQLRLFERQLTQIERQLRDFVQQEAELWEKIKNIDTIDGVGFMTIVTILAETDGFALIENEKQLASYAGLDVVHNDSGLKRGKTAISKKGNKFIRNAVYMPALSACRCNKPLQKVYTRLLIRKNNKKIALIAIARKLLLLIFTIWKKNVPFDPDYQSAYAIAKT